jgi:hypothetical protein
MREAGQSSDVGQARGPVVDEKVVADVIVPAVGRSSSMIPSGSFYFPSMCVGKGSENRRRSDDKTDVRQVQGHHPLQLRTKCRAPT